jgi:hypothetical protein
VSGSWSWSGASTGSVGPVTATTDSTGLASFSIGPQQTGVPETYTFTTSNTDVAATPPGGSSLRLEDIP